jgi:HD-GYP domain-containing protein (c-di-GMP phosphodiesterase class II)
VRDAGTPTAIPGLRALSPRARTQTDGIHALVDGLRAAASFASYQVTRPHPLLVQIGRDHLRVLLTPAEVWDRGRNLFLPYADAIARMETRVILLGRPNGPDVAQALNHGVCAIVPEAPSHEELYVATHQAFEFMEVKARSESRGKWLNRYRYELGELIEIARALTTEREIDRLLALILEKSRFVTAADAGSIYVVEGTDPQIGRRQLRFKLSQNDSLSFDSSEFTMPISPRSMAGYVALERQTVNIEDVYDMPAGSPFGFDRSFDERVGYRTKSMVTTPLMSSKGEVIGVLQLINKKREPKTRLLAREDFERIVVPFDDRSKQLLETLASQAGIALENALLYDEIRGIFEGFVHASVEAIESRDPTTSGHSRRVAGLTVELAQALEHVDTGPYREVTWTREDLREIEYASLLHDFGKIGVREDVLVKANKLFPHDLRAVRQRFDFVIRTAQADILARKVRAVQRGADVAELEELDRELAARVEEFEAAWNTIQHANQPTVLAAGDFEVIADLGRRTYVDLAGETLTLLSPTEVECLSVPRGSLTHSEFDEIRSHVTHTYRFLSQIPWGKTFGRIAIIAGSHHERLNGTGYPNRLHAEEIPLQSKMMSISDIFDALTASDRPYKKAVPVERALDILGYEVRDGHVDGELVRVFVESRPWERVGVGSMKPRS